MTETQLRSDPFQEYRQAIRELCAGFNSKYWQDVEEQRQRAATLERGFESAGWRVEQACKRTPLNRTKTFGFKS